MTVVLHSSSFDRSAWTTPRRILPVAACTPKLAIVARRDAMQRPAQVEHGALRGYAMRMSAAAAIARLVASSRAAARLQEQVSRESRETGYGRLPRSEVRVKSAELNRFTLGKQPSLRTRGTQGNRVLPPHPPAGRAGLRSALDAECTNTHPPTKFAMLRTPGPFRLKYAVEGVLHSRPTASEGTQKPACVRNATCRATAML